VAVSRKWTDRVQLEKQESAALGGEVGDEAPFAVPINPQQDAIELAGVVFQDASNRDEEIWVQRNGDDLEFRDLTNPGGFTLEELASGGFTEAQHEAFDTLAHELVEDAYEEYAYSGARVTGVITWATPSKLLKIREEQFTYSGNNLTVAITIQYDGAGAELYRLTETLTYSGGRVTSVSNVRS